MCTKTFRPRLTSSYNFLSNWSQGMGLIGLTWVLCPSITMVITIITVGWNTHSQVGVIYLFLKNVRGHIFSAYSPPSTYPNHMDWVGERRFSEGKLRLLTKRNEWWGGQDHRWRMPTAPDSPNTHMHTTTKGTDYLPGSSVGCFWIRRMMMVMGFQITEPANTSYGFRSHWEVPQ